MLGNSRCSRSVPINALVTMNSSSGIVGHPEVGQKRASGKSWSQIMRLRSLGLGEFSEIVHEVGDNVLYHSLSRLKDDRKKNADAIEFCEVDDAVSGIFAR